MAELAKTIAQLSTSITLRALPQDINLDALGSADTLAKLQQQKVLGAVITFSEENPRGTTPRYELDADRAGEMVERTPGLADNTLTLNRVVLYTDGDLLQAVGFAGASSILDQNAAFCILKEERNPQTNVTSHTIYGGCWFHNLPKTYDITGDLRVMQNVEVGYTKKVVV